MKALIVTKDRKLVSKLNNKFSGKEGCTKILWSSKTALNQIENLLTPPKGEKKDKEINFIVLDWLRGNKKKIFLLTKKIRRVNDVPILALIDKAETSNIVKALDIGIDDCLIKPLSFEELEARINSLKRRSNRLIFRGTKLSVGKVLLDIKKHTLRVNGNLTYLTRIEYLILTYLLLHKDSVVAKAELENHLLRTTKGKVNHSINTHILNLRKKLGSNFLIKTVPKEGFIVSE